MLDFIDVFGFYWIALEVEMVRLAGLEPVTPTMSRWCSNQLSYSRTEWNGQIIYCFVFDDK